MIVLSIDTCLQACSAAIVRDGAPLAVRSEGREKGHAERLAPLVAEALDVAGISPADINRIGVTTGPGSFTGVRVGLAFARGLAVARPVELVGITTLEAIAAAVSVHDGAVRGVLIDGRRGQVYGQLFDGAALVPLAGPFVENPDIAATLLLDQAAGRDLVLAGTGVPLAFPDRKDDFDWAAQQPDPVVIASLAASRAADREPPAAVYLRPPDAKPARPML
ncbi:tRNA (adenosine(37)-N6)-threonylcarbamoyltransferase complex dimerization subunit type 1 TsaB [Aquisalinus flavus]|uniref:tRNA (Adenosine(37)-N6)-threonylcarbamoyltransferase complex dimerization subunit type 1 TsaB n=1 Tax=Aquisalinus flavus TaxID=1526572 RepID=A0A8J2V4W9_9PROT|nr:tRNA (adenosine(37)-N6)-threonylcarbamoyltransferase complex dimerization subunit type 1 TsaB [Aquisalinus flavus]MBD0425689.1 tRNA (adenosine(37)-N6)-threonylcarbamoyltransferase complex dimerization subunit type 1 TsaB [Aquisalinus flavus]UNE48699.1 tRNA (adenosine(37)-N6)-threonylcarbamoyltransferase complex dimerization subunit type 1 TsaB [Aquisalinus flavus]GGD14059.1 tRNA (adenosine(37)-N6)-threonylcarbamoyltransferase complex dimerization subunit type 1 TsaB [Aquisalinus flavus]